MKEPSRNTVDRLVLTLGILALFDSLVAFFVWLPNPKKDGADIMIISGLALGVVAVILGLVVRGRLKDNAARKRWVIGVVGGAMATAFSAGLLAARALFG